MTTREKTSARRVRLGLSVLLVIFSLPGLSAADAAPRGDPLVLDLVAQELAPPSGGSGPRSLAMPGVPTTLTWGARDADLVSYVGAFSYRLSEVGAAQAPELQARLKALSETALFAFREVENRPFKTRTNRASFVRSFSLASDGVRGHRLLAGDALLDRTKLSIFPGRSFRAPVQDYDGGRIWMELYVDVSRPGIPVSPPVEFGRPIALSFGQRLFLFSEHYDPNESSPSALAVNRDRSSFVFANRDDKRIDAIVERYATLLVEQLRQPPISASIDLLVPGLAVLTHVGQNPLLGGKYEKAGYTVHVYRLGAVVKDFIRFEVLAANHPDNPHYDLSSIEAQRFQDKLGEVRNHVTRQLCSELKGRFQAESCRIEVQ